MVKTRLFKANDSLIPFDEHLATFQGNKYSLKEKNEAKTDKTKHGIGKSVKNQSQKTAAPAGEQSGPPAPKTAKQLTAKRNQDRAAIKSWFGGNDESKKMQRNVLKHQFENFTTAPNESLDKAYDSSTNEVSTASGNFRVNTAGGTSSTSQVLSTPGADEVIDQDNLEELDIRWQVAMLTVRVQRFIQKTRRNLDFKGKQHVTFDKSKVKCYNCHRKGHLAKECKSERNQGKISYGDNGRRNATTNEPSLQGTGGFKEGYGTQLDEMSNKSKTDSEISMSVFEVRSSDEEITPANDRFSKADRYHVVPPPITGNFLTPRADISFAGLDEYAIRKKIIESKTTELNIDTSKSKTSEIVGKTNEVNIEKPKSVHKSVVPKPKINRDKGIIEDWYSNDEDDVSEVNTVGPIKTNETQTVKTQVDKIG
ncbi:ribonuclease H-like domain-containing protein [Tanacetum coccineum]|uniref:Ribonuclease H-like domain-containing protein n=1 Tax=Tanacetum coccineum TaxID=301880 RepID=A0ABQ5IA49_9ASTR